MQPRSIDTLRERVGTWEETIRPDSALYARLARHVAGSEGLLEVLQLVPPGQIEMNMLLAAVQYLLIANPDSDLAAWYPSLGGTRDDSGLESEFESFVFSNGDEIQRLISTKRVQTNEVARCSFLLPAYNVVAAMTGAPLAIIEVGTSAGLNQNVDRYGYTYSSDAGSVTLAPDAAVQLECATGARVPPSAGTLPPIVWRCGIDLHPVDVTDPDQAMWLRALVWPDQPQRHIRLAGAIETAATHPPIVIAGDALEALPDLVAAAPPEAALIVQHSFVLNQVAREDRERFFDQLDELAGERAIYRVGAEWVTKIRHTILDITTHGANRTTWELGEVHHHGTWIRLSGPLVRPGRPAETPDDGEGP